jgi:hypothetical protein
MVTRRGAVAASGLALAGAVSLYLGTRGPSAASSPGAANATRTTRASGEVARIDLARLESPRPEPVAGRRDIFEFGAARSSRGPGQGGPGAQAASTPPPSLPPPPVTEPTPPPVPALNVKFIGSVETKQGLKVAVLMTDKKEILTGQAGDLVANRLRIVKIGLESVDVQDLGSSNVRRIPLRGN